jgi:hypothetical protein
MDRQTRQPKGSDEAYSVTLSCKVSREQAEQARQAADGNGESVGTWLRKAAVRAYSSQAAGR